LDGGCNWQAVTCSCCQKHVNEPGFFYRELAVDFGAGEGIRTLDPNLGKVVLYP
jgi:hypothetical protein